MFKHLKSLLVKAALFTASFAASAGVLLAVGTAFHDASSQPWLRDSPQARLAVARCDSLGDRGARQLCVGAAVAAAQARDAGAAQVAALQAPTPWARKSSGR